MTTLISRSKIHSLKQMILQYSYLGDNNVNNIRKNICKILTSKKFKSNPSAYMINWKQKRGKTEEFRTIEDPSLAIITAFMKL